MEELTNADRAEWANESIRLFAQNTGLDMSVDEVTAFKDLLADMRHWCAERDIDFNFYADNSESVFYDEVAEEAYDKEGVV